MKHTPGPWLLWGASDVFSKAGKAMVASACSPRGSNFVEYRKLEIDDADFDEACANARLIAAAPELLEALVALRAAEWGDASEIVALRNKADAAIAKVTGEAS